MKKSGVGNFRRLFLGILSVYSSLLIDNTCADMQERDFNKLLKIYQKQLSRKSGRDKYGCAVSKIKEGDFYKLVVDRARLQNYRRNLENPEGIKSTEKTEMDTLAELEIRAGFPREAYLFDVNEPGYLDAMTKTFNEVVANSVGLPISIGLIRNIHDSAVEGVQDRKNKMNLGFSQDMQHYGIGNEEIDPTDLIEDGILGEEEAYQSVAVCPPLASFVNSKGAIGGIYTNIGQITQWYYQNSKESGNKKQLFKNQDFIEKALEARLSPEFKKYRNEIARAASDDAKFTAIATLLRKLEMAHLFDNGNQRTYAFALLDLLLIQNNFPPAILSDTYLFDGYKKYSKEEMANQIKEGIKNYLTETHLTAKVKKSSLFSKSKKEIEKVDFKLDCSRH